ncbi:MAG: hypothetical protein LUC83_00075 [Clostridiales bacterium]|nr:hypothetical protein [Clostridiales bacterium]
MKESIYGSYTPQGDIALQFDEGTVVVSASGNLVAQEGFCPKSLCQQYCETVKRHAADKSVTSSDLRMLRILGDAADILNERAKKYPSDHIPVSYREIGITADGIRMLDHETVFFAPGNLTGYVSDVLDENSIPYEGYSAPDIASLRREIQPDVPCLKEISDERIREAFARYPGITLSSGMSVPFLVSRCNPEDLFRLSLKFYGDTADENFLNREYDRGRYNFQLIQYNWSDYGFSGEPGAGLNIINPYGDQADGLSYYRLGSSESENGSPSRLLLVSTFNHWIDSGFFRDPETNKIYEVETKVSQLILETKGEDRQGFSEVLNEPVLNRYHGRPTGSDLTGLLTASAAYQSASAIGKAELEFIGNPAFDDACAYYPEDEVGPEAFVIWIGERYQITFSAEGTVLSEELPAAAKGTASKTGNSDSETQCRTHPILTPEDTEYLKKLFPERFDLLNRLTRTATGKPLP